MKAAGWLGAGLLLSCAGAGTERSVEAVSTLVSRPDLRGLRFYTNLVSPARLVVKDAAVWGSVWRSIVGKVSPTPPEPSVDFAHEMVVVAAMGQRPTGGYVIDVIDAVSDKDGKLKVAVTETSPGQHCAVTDALTEPVDVVIVRRTEGAVDFGERQQTRDCL
jgi:hypothetical protein